MTKTLIVPLDGSPDAERGLHVARVIAYRLDAATVIATTVPADADDTGAKRYAAALRQWIGWPDLEIVVGSPGNAAESIARLAEDAPDSMICMTTSGRGRVTSAVLGGTALDVVRHCKMPVVLVGPHVSAGWFAEPPRLLTCWAGGQPDPILEVARALSDELEGELWLETVHHPLDVQTAFEMQPALDVLGSARTHVHQEAGYDPAGTIVEAARHLEVMLVAMTTQARSGISRVVLGSVTTAVVHGAPCPVLVLAAD